MESIRLEKPSNSPKSKCRLSAIESRPQVPQAHISGALPGVVAPCTACSSAFPCIFLWISMPLMLSSVNISSFSTAQTVLSSLSSPLALSHLLLPTFPGPPCLCKSSGFQVCKELEPGPCQQVLVMLPHVLLRKGLEHPSMWDYCP